MKIKEMFAYLCVKDMNKAVAFYGEVFGAREKFRLTEPSGRVGHLELAFGEHATLMLSEEFPDHGIVSPGPNDKRSFALHLHVDNADAVIARALGAGATMMHELQDQFYGERSGTFRDPFGHQWNIGHQIEEVAPAEMQRRYDEMMKKARG